MKKIIGGRSAEKLPGIPLAMAVSWCSLRGTAGVMGCYQQ
jgi:hypothetical protein